ncbi:hypothetical protein Hanom_Chr06g00522351 [Helianthus anomalus]
MPRFEPNAPLNYEEFTTGLGFKFDSSSEGSPESSEKSSVVLEHSPLTVEDCDSSDDESDEDKTKQSEMVTKEENIPLENHILCDPSTKPFVTATVKSVESSSVSCESVILLYTLIGSDKIYSDKDFPIKNVNQSLIDKIFEDSTSKFLGKSSPRVVITQCSPIPKSEVRKKYGNQKLQTQNNQRNQNHAKQEKDKGKQSQSKKKIQMVNIVKSRGTDKIETFENKSNTDFVKQSKILKRNSQNNYTQHTNGCDVRSRS